MTAETARKMEDPAPPAERIVEVAFPIPARKRFSYRAAGPASGAAWIGRRVAADLAGRRLCGVVVAEKTRFPSEKSAEKSAGLSLRPASLLDSPDRDPVFPEELLELAQEVGRWSFSSPGEVLAAMAPPRVKRIPEISSSLQGGGEIQRGPEGLPEELREAAEAAGELSEWALLCPSADRRFRFYAEVASRCLRQSRSCLILVPLASWAEGLARRLGGLAYHGQMSAGRRLAIWERCRAAAVVIGTRIAVFLPFHRLGAVIVEHDGDPAYQNPSRPFYEAGRAAAWRARRHGAALYRGGAIPTAETYAAVREGRLRWARYIGPLPAARWADPREIRSGATGLARPLEEALRRCLGAGGRAALVRPRRGYWRRVECAVCGTVRSCGNCGRPLSVDRIRRRLLCYLCGGRSEEIPSACCVCGGRLEFRAPGIQWHEERLRKEFAEVSISRVEADGSGADPGARMWIGTRSLGPCLNLPVPSLVAASPDADLEIAEYSSSHAAAAMLWGMAGWPDPSDPRSSIFLETRLAGHPAVDSLLRGDPIRFLEQELSLRRSFGFPPARRIVRVDVLARSDAAAAAAGRRLCLELRNRLPATAAEVSDPAPGVPARIGGRHRIFLLVRLLDLPEEFAPIWESLRVSGGQVRVIPDPIEVAG